MPAVPFVMAAVTASGVAATIGAATAALVGATVTGAVATAIGAGVVSAGVGLAQGKSISDSLKGAVIGGVASFVGAGIASDVTSSIVEAAGGAGASSISTTFANVAGSMAGGATRGAIGAVLSGQDPIEALIQGGLAAGLTTGIGSLTSEIPGFSELKEQGEMGAAAQRAINSALTAGALGRDVGESVTQSLLGSLSRSGGTAFGADVKDLSGNLRSAYDDANNTETQLKNNIDQQNKYVEDYNTQLAEAQAKQSVLQEKYNRYLQFNDEGNTEAAAALAQEINAEAPELESAKANLARIESSLNNAKEQYTALESSYTDKRSALDETVKQFKEQEEANAVAVQKAFDRALDIKETSEEKLGSELSQEQLDALIGSNKPAEAIEKVLENSEGKDAKTKQEMLDNYLGVNEKTALIDPTVDDTEAEIVNKLKDLGYTKEQVQGYLGTTNDLSEYFKEPPEGPPADAIEQLKNAGLKENEDLPYLPTDDDFVPTSEIEKPEEEETDWASLYNTNLSEEEIAKREALLASLPNQEMQIDPENWDSFDKNLSDIMTNKGGYTSQWQTVGSDRIMINDDGTAIGTNENGDSYALDEDQVNSMIKNGLLNTAESGYVAATGGTGNTPGGSGSAPTAPPKAPAPTVAKPGTAPITTGTAPQPVARQSAVQEMAPALLGIPGLGNVFYYGKDFSSQKQQLDPSGRLIQQEYDPLSLTQAGPELQLDKMGGNNENDVQALIQQIMANSGGNISPEELAQILGQQGASYG
jgi:predicted  nucleic acid-binding Zn-ribbon protein